MTYNGTPPTPTRTRRLPPHDLDAEAATLGAMMLSGNAAANVLATGLDPGHFYSPINASVYDAICNAIVAGANPPDPVTVAAQLSATDRAATNDAKTLLTMIGGVGSTNNAPAYAYRILTCAHHRRLIGYAHELTEAIYTDQDIVIEATLDLLVEEHAPLVPTGWTTYYVDWPGVETTPDDGWLIEPFLAHGRAHALWAVAKAGKSLLALEAAAALATGAPFLDSPARAPIDVLYVDVEMTRADVRERVADLGVNPLDLEHLHYMVQPPLPPLDTAAGGATLRGIAHQCNAQLVVIDTLTSTVAGEENDADTYRAVARHTTGPLKADGITTLRLDHGGKDADKGMRGSAAKAEDVDVVWRLIRNDPTRLRLTATHRRIPWVPASLDLIRDDEPVHHHIAEGRQWPAGTAETADLIDTLSLPLDASVRPTMDALRTIGEGRRQQVVAAALRWRRHPHRRTP